MTKQLETARCLLLGMLILFSGTIEADPGEVIPDDLITTEPGVSELPSVVAPSFMPEFVLYSLFCDDAKTLQENTEQAGGTLVLKGDVADGSAGFRFYHNFLSGGSVWTVLNRDDPTRECVMLMSGADTLEILIEHTPPEIHDPCSKIHPELKYEDGKCSMPLPVPEYDSEIADPNEQNRRKMEEELRRLLNERINGESHF